LATIYNLTSLNLSQNERITNRGAASLAALSNLKALNLSNTRVNSEALKFFSGLSQLQSLALYGCKDIEDNPKMDSLQSELPLLRCVRLNNANNEDGVIDHGSESEEEAEEEADDADGEMDYNFELDDESSQRRRLLEHDRFYHQLESEGDSVSSEEGMSVFEDAQNEEIDVSMIEDKGREAEEENIEIERGQEEEMGR
jgi:cell division septum initiation protein DivIVA